MKNKTKNVNSFKLDEEPNNIDIKKNIINQDFTKGINILNKFDTFALDMKINQKIKINLIKLYIITILTKVKI
jgi:hypothetical protein